MGAAPRSGRRGRGRAKGRPVRAARSRGPLDRGAGAAAARALAARVARATDRVDVGVYLPRRVGAGGTLTLGDADRYVLKGPGIHRHWIVTDAEGAEAARIRAYPDGEPPQHRPVSIGPQVDGQPTAALAVLAACLAVIISEAEPRHRVCPLPTW